MNFVKAQIMGAKFVFIKVSERAGMDEDFFYNWKNAKAAGLFRGGYHFLRWDISELTQARIFGDLLRDDPGELPPICDFEAPPKDGKFPSNAMLSQFLEAVEAITGKKPMIYTSPGFWNSYGKNKTTGKFDAFWSNYPLWIAHYTTASAPILPEPWKSANKPWLFWQHSNTGDGLKFGAESKSIDLNWFNGSQADLRSFMQGHEAKIPEQQNPQGSGSEGMSGNTPTGGGEGSTIEAPVGGISNAYLQKEIDLVGSRVKALETFLGSYRLP